MNYMNLLSILYVCNTDTTQSSVTSNVTLNNLYLVPKGYFFLYINTYICAIYLISTKINVDI